MAYVWDILFFDLPVTPIKVTGTVIALFAIYLGSTSVEVAGQSEVGFSKCDFVRVYEHVHVHVHEAQQIGSGTDFWTRGKYIDVNRCVHIVEKHAGVVYARFKLPLPWGSQGRLCACRSPATLSDMDR